MSIKISTAFKKLFNRRISWPPSAWHRLLGIAVLIGATLLLLHYSFRTFSQAKTEFIHTQNLYEWLVAQPVPTDRGKLPSSKEFLNIILQSANKREISFTQVQPRDEQAQILCSFINVDFNKIIHWLDHIFYEHPYIDVAEFSAHAASSNGDGLVNISLTFVLNPVGSK